MVILLITCNANDCVFQILECMDGDFYNELGATVLLLGARECLLSASDGEVTMILTVDKFSEIIFDLILL